MFYNASISALLPTKRTIIEHSTPVLFYCYLFNVINYIDILFKSVNVFLWKKGCIYPRNDRLKLL